MRLLFIVCFSCLLPIYTMAQVPVSNDSIVVIVPTYIDNLTETIEGQGSIVISQDQRISQLIESHIALNLENESKISGWRIQIYNSSGTESRKEAENVRKRFLEKYPDMYAYMIYQPPFFKIRVGDFRTREEAFMLYKKIIVDFPVSYMVNDNINLPKL